MIGTLHLGVPVVQTKSSLDDGNDGFISPRNQ